MIKEGIPHQWSVTIFLCGPLLEGGIFRFVLQSFIEGVNSESMSSRLTVCVPEVYTFCVDDIKKSELFNSPSVSLFFFYSPYRAWNPGEGYSLIWTRV